VTVTLEFFVVQKLTSAYLFVLNGTVFLNLVIIFFMSILTCLCGFIYLKITYSFFQ